MGQKRDEGAGAEEEKLPNHSRASKAASAEQHGSAWPRFALHTTDAAFVAESENLLLLQTVVSPSRTAAASSCCMEAPLNSSSTSLPAMFLLCDAAAGHSGG